MKRIILAVALVLSLPAVAGPYVQIGGAGGSDSGGLNLAIGVRGANIGLEAIGSNEKRQRTTATVVNGGVTYQDSTVTVHGVGAAILGYAPLTKVKATGADLELVGRISRERLRIGDAEEWRTGVGAGVQYGSRGSLGLQLMVERAGDETRGRVGLVKEF